MSSSAASDCSMDSIPSVVQALHNVHNLSIMSIIQELFQKLWTLHNPLLVFNPTQLKVVPNSLLVFTCNVSLYLALNFLVEKSINNGPASS